VSSRRGVKFGLWYVYLERGGFMFHAFARHGGGLALRWRDRYRIFWRGA